MFEKALITKVGTTTQSVDLGLLAETLFFYGSIQLVLGIGGLASLAKSVSTDDLMSLLERECIKLSFVRSGFGVLAHGPFMEVGSYQWSNEKKSKPYREQIEIVLTRVLGAGSSTKKLVKAVCDRSVEFKFDTKTATTDDLLSQFRSDTDDSKYLTQAARTVISSLVPSLVLPNDFRFAKVATSNGNFIVDTNLDFNSCERIHGCRLSSDSIVAFIMDARIESFYAATYMAELVTTPTVSSLINLKNVDLLRARTSSNDAIEQFAEIVLPNFPTIRESINSGSRSIADFLKLLDRADRFKSWLRQINPDRGLLAEYVTKAMEKSWADELPAKSVRFVFFTALGMVAESIVPTGIGKWAGFGVGAIDSLCLDSLLKGWRPNQFVEGPFRQFVS
jgi:hypothetical protein